MLTTFSHHPMLHAISIDLAWCLIDRCPTLNASNNFKSYTAKWFLFLNLFQQWPYSWTLHRWHYLPTNTSSLEMNWSMTLISSDFHLFTHLNGWSGQRFWSVYFDSSYSCRCASRCLECCLPLGGPLSYNRWIQLELLALSRSSSLRHDGGEGGRGKREKKRESTRCWSNCGHGGMGFHAFEYLSVGETKRLRRREPKMA